MDGAPKGRFKGTGPGTRENEPLIICHKRQGEMTRKGRETVRDQKQRETSESIKDTAKTGKDT